MTAIVLSSLLTTPCCSQFLSHCKHLQHQANPIGGAGAVKNACEVGSHRGGRQVQFGRDLLVLLAAQNQLDDPCLLGRERKLIDDCLPDGLVQGSGRRLAFGLPAGKWLGIAGGSRKTGRQTKAAQRTPSTGHTERTLAGAPFGARLQGTASVLGNVAVFARAVA